MYLCMYTVGKQQCIHMQSRCSIEVDYRHRFLASFFLASFSWHASLSIVLLYNLCDQRSALECTHLFMTCTLSVEWHAIVHHP